MVYQNEKHFAGTTREPLFRFYRHFDGYPEGHGLEMAEALARLHGNAEVTNRNWAQWFCVEFFGKGENHFGKMFYPDCDFESWDCEWYADLEYVYTVTGEADFTGGKHRHDNNVEIAFYDAWGTSSREACLAREPLFKGTAEEYIDWIHDYINERD